MDDCELLRVYVENQSEPAFAELVGRHLPIVLATAHRLVRESQLAQDVAQTAFIHLARKAWTIRQGQSLSGWLYRATQHAAFDALRKEQRRQQRETEVMKLAETECPTPAAWEQLAPLLDEAMRHLKRGEQDALLLRFFEDKSFGEVGRILGLEERTAGQRVNRALEKLRVYFSRRGVTTTTALLASAITANAALPPAAGMATSVAGISLAHAGHGAVSAWLIKIFSMTTKTKATLAAAVVITAATISTLTQQQEIKRLQAELAAKNTPAGRPVENRAKSGALPHNLSWDIHGPLADILKKYKGADLLAAILKLVDQTPIADLAHLLDEAAACPQPEIWLSVYGAAMAKWAHADPTGALAYAEAMAPKPGILAGAAALNPVFMTWAADNPRAALAAATKLARASYRASAVNQVLSVWVQGDNPLEAISAAKSLPKGLLKSDPLTTVFQAWAQSDPAAALANVNSITSATGRRSVMNSIITNIADSDPKQAFSLLRNQPVGQQNAQLYGKVFQSWAIQDPAAALAALPGLPAGSTRAAATQSVFSSWAEQDPTAALQAVGSLTLTPERNLAQQAVVDGLAQQDPAAAAKLMEDLPPGATRNSLIASITKIWGDTDPAAALAWLSANAKGSAFTSSLPGILTNLSANDPNAALAYVSQLPQGPQRETDFGNVLGQFAKDDPASAVDWLNKNLSGDEHDAALASVVGQLAKTDPDTAATLYNQMAAGGPRDSITATVANSLAAEDTQTALAWMQNLPADTNDTVRGQVIQNIVKTWKNVDPAAAANYVQNYASDPNMAGAAGGVAYAYAQLDGPAALAWAQSLPSGATQDNAVRSTVTGMAQTDPAAAWQNAVAIAAQQDTINRQTAINGPTLRQIITAWADTDPASAAQAALNISTSGTRINSITAVATSWVQQDPAEFATWMQSLPEGPERDAAIAPYIASQAASDPAAAFKLASSVGDAAVRYNLIATSAMAWTKKDPAAAQAAVNAAPITAAQQRTILTAIRK